MMCDGCLLQEKVDEADFIIEMRESAPWVPTVTKSSSECRPTTTRASRPPSLRLRPLRLRFCPPCRSFRVAKKDDQMAAAKVALFAYNRHTREPIWQSGISESRSVVADRWYFGAGPFQKGNIYSSKKQSDSSLFSSDDAEAMKPDYFVERRFADPTKSLADTPPAAKTAAVAAAPAATPAVAAAQPAKAAGTAPAATTPAASPTTTPAATPPAAAATTAVAAAPVANPPTPGPSVPITTPATAASTTASATQPVTATQTVNAAPVVAAAPTASAAPATNATPAAANAGSPTAANLAPTVPGVAPIAPKTGPSTTSIPNGQPVNGAAPSTGSSTVAVPDMLSVSLH